MPIDHVNALPPGTRFEEYRLDAVLGSGGFGITYRAYDTNLDKFVAIKEYLPGEFATRAERYTVVPQSSTDAQDYHWGLNRFLDEARTLARFDHPHLNKVYRFFESNGTAYMVLEYVEGETLADKLTRERQLPEEALQRLLDEVLSGLAVMHEAGYVHRDIKPGNLMLREEDGSAVVLDFGAARQAVGQRSKAITSILTPGYAPIEQYDSHADDVGPWSDIYALGMVAYRCISGISDSELPDAVTRGRTQRKGQVGLTSAVEAGKGQYNAKLLEAIDWAIEVDEEGRPQTVEEWQRALAGSGRRKGPAKSVRRTASRSASGGVITERTGMNWSGVALTVSILALVGVSVWMASQLYPEWFKQISGDILSVAQQEIPADIPKETQQETETVETGVDMEETPTPDLAESSTESVDPAEPVVESPATELAKAASVEEDEVTQLLAAAEADLKARRLTSPAGNNAWDRYQQVLELQPTNPDAIKGMERVIDGYMELFGAAVEQEDFDKAAGYLTRIRELHPDSPALEQGARRIEAAKQARSDRLAKQQVIRERMESFDTALRRNALDEAAGYLDLINTLDATAPALADGHQRLAEARQAEAERQAELARQHQAELERHTGLFEAAIQDGQLHEAADHLAQMRAMEPDSPVLDSAEQRLAEAEIAEQERQRQAEEAARKAELERQQREAEERARAAVGELVDIPGGTFRMGGKGDDDEKPVHDVTVPAFRLGKYEVTVGQFRGFVEATEYITDAERNANDKEGCVTYSAGDGWKWRRGRSWRDPGYSVGDDHPVVCVSWNDAQAFVVWLTEQTGESYRLPSEAEWEYAVRAGSTKKYHFGNSKSQLCRYANHADSSTDYSGRNKSCSDGVGKRTAVVGHYQPNTFGLYDMHGNAWELVQDCWNENYRGAPSNGRAWTSGDCSRHVLRGGSWGHAPEHLRSAARGRSTRSFRDDAVGFRLAQDK